ncbi:MAG: Crp/Fnr family transcriptional regulator [Ignavibacteria bacterium]|nr:MAG: Crp/Fnr family transcriptional regulator [Ignavibacteria bacterium]
MAEQSKLWFLENFNLFEGLGKEEMEKLNSITTMQEIEKSQPIYFAKEPSKSIYFLKRGRVKLTRTSPDGKEMILALVNPGEVFGELSILDGEERTDYAIAMDNCLICAISREEFLSFISKRPELNLKITKLIGFKIRKYSEKIEQLIFKDAAQRVITFILDQATNYGKKIGNQLFIKPFLTHQDIAELTACSRQTVNAVLTELREDGIIDFDRRKLVINDEEELRKRLD